jgi:hypothetical protein
MTDLQRNPPDGVAGGYDRYGYATSGQAENKSDVTVLSLTVTPEAARALLALLIRVHRKREKLHNPKEEK